MKMLPLTVALVFCGVIQGQNSKKSVSERLSQVDTCILQAEYYINRNLDSALFFARKAEKLLDESDADRGIDVYSCLGETYSAKGDMDKGLEYLLLAKRLVDAAFEERPNDTQVIAERSGLSMRMGVLKFNLRQYEASLIDYQSALEDLESLQGKLSEQDLAQKKIVVYNNIAGVYLQIDDFDTALAYYQNALKLNETLQNEVYESSLTNNIGICYLEKKEHDLADHYLLRSLAIRTKSNDKRGQAQCLNSLAKNQIYQGNFTKAQGLFEKALGLGREVGHAQSMLVTLESLSNVYDTLGAYKKGLTTFREFKSLSDSIFNQTSAANMAALETDYRRDKEEKVAELELQRNAAETQRAETRNYAILGGSFFLLLTAGLFLVLMRGRVKRSQLEQEKLRLESVNSELEKRTLLETIDFKERELTANALFLLRNNELLSSISEKLLNAKSTFRQENQKIIQDVIFELRANQNQNVWEDFEAHFIRVHADFYQKLQAQFPNLTSNEMKLCAFLRLNMSTKEISAITQQTVNSITVARSRLRKKLNIDGEDTQLINFLLQL